MGFAVSTATEKNIIHIQFLYLSEVRTETPWISKATLVSWRVHDTVEIWVCLKNVMLQLPCQSEDGLDGNLEYYIFSEAISSPYFKFIVLIL